MGNIRITLGILAVSAFLCVVAGCASSTSPTTFTQLSTTSQAESRTTIASTTSLAPPAPTGDKAVLLAEIVRIRAGLKDGTLVADWNADPRELPSDFQVLLDGLEKLHADLGRLGNLLQRDLPQLPFPAQVAAE